MRSFFAVALVATLANALPARDYNAAPSPSPSSQEYGGYKNYARPQSTSNEAPSSSAHGYWPDHPSKSTSSVRVYYAQGDGTSSALSSSSSSLPWSKPSKSYKPKESHRPATVTVTAAQATVTVTPDGHLWSPSHPFSGGYSGNHGSCDSSSGPYASKSQSYHDGSYGSSGGFYGSAGYPAGISEPIEHDGPVEHLKPVVHWNVDTAPAENVIPVPVGHGCPQYYAQGGNTGIPIPSMALSF
jgi:hypothetical protein